MDSSTPIWALVLAFFCPPLIYTNLITFRSVPGFSGYKGAARGSSCSALSTFSPRSASCLVSLCPSPGLGHVLGGGLLGQVSPHRHVSLWAILLPAGMALGWLSLGAGTFPVSLPNLWVKKLHISGEFLSPHPHSVLLSTPGSQRRSPHRRTWGLTWTGASMGKGLSGEPSTSTTRGGAAWSSGDWEEGQRREVGLPKILV